MSQAPDQLQEELRRLIERVRPWSFDRWAARATGRDGTRADAGYELVLALAAALPSTPAGVRPSRLRDISIADQLTVMLLELSRSALPDDELDALLVAVRATRDAIEAPPLA